MKKFFLSLFSALMVLGLNAQSFKYVDSDSFLNRFLGYVKIESQSIDVPDPEVYPMSEGQKEIARLVYDEIKSFGSKDLQVTLSPDNYIYVKVPSNIKKKVPSVLFMAHLDVTPEANGKGINPQIHYNYDGKPIELGDGKVLSPDSPEGKRLKELVGKTIITTDGSTLLGGDDKCGCTILVSMIEELVKNKSIKHGDVYVCLSQNEDVGKAADRFFLDFFDKVPEIVIDVDGSDPNVFSVENFTAVACNYYFEGNMAHPSEGLKNKYADARTAMSYFIGCLPPEVHPSASSDKKGYIHCFYTENAKDANGNTIESDFIARLRIRYFDKADGELYDKYLDEAVRKTTEAFPFVKVRLADRFTQYDNIAYTMYPGTVDVILNAAKKTNIDMRPSAERGGTTSAMLVTRNLPGGPCIFSGQQAPHSLYEWTCLEDMMQQLRLVLNIVDEVRSL